MNIQEIRSRVFYVRQECVLEKAFGVDEESMHVGDGRCLYLARLELAPQDHPEIDSNKLDFYVKTSMSLQYWAKGFGGGQKGWSGDIIPFEQLIASAEMPKSRAEESADAIVQTALGEIFSGQHFNVRARFYSAFDGYRDNDGFGHLFNKAKTYLPLLIPACREVFNLCIKKSL